MTLVAVARSNPRVLRQDVEVAGHHHLSTDELLEIGGGDTAASPHELLPAALAACVSTQLLMYARTKEWDIGDVAVHVEYDHRSTPRHFEIAVELGGDLTAAQLDRLGQVARGCPVRRALEGGAEFSERVLARSVAHTA